MRAWLAENHQVKHRVHQHAPEDFGMSAESVNRDFRDYVERFGFGFGLRAQFAA